MRSTVMIVAVLGMAACTPVVPDSGAGVGFQDYNSYQPQSAAPVATAPVGGFSTASAAAAIDAAEGNAPLSALGTPVTAVPATETRGIIIGSGQRPRGNAPAGIQETTSEMAGVASGTVAVSDENDFEAVSARETIESDKARIERNRAQYQVDQPVALPQRTGDSEPNIVQFALSTSHSKGTQMYNRGGIHFTSYNAACAKYPSPDLAQEAFLAAGGPNRDRLNVDPDGDGFACAWDPSPFRSALQ